MHVKTDTFTVSRGQKAPQTNPGPKSPLNEELKNINEGSDAEQVDEEAEEQKSYETHVKTHTFSISRGQNAAQRIPGPKSPLNEELKNIDDGGDAEEVDEEADEKNPELHVKTHTFSVSRGQNYAERFSGPKMRSMSNQEFGKYCGEAQGRTNSIQDDEVLAEKADYRKMGRIHGIGVRHLVHDCSDAREHLGRSGLNVHIRIDDDLDSVSKHRIGDRTYSAAGDDEEEEARSNRSASGRRHKQKARLHLRRSPRKNSNGEAHSHSQVNLMNSSLCVCHRRLSLTAITHGSPKTACENISKRSSHRVGGRPRGRVAKGIVSGSRQEETRNAHESGFCPNLPAKSYCSPDNLFPQHSTG